MDIKEKPTMVVVSVEDWEEYQELKKNRETKEFKLEVGGDYIAKNNEEGVIIDRKGDYDNVGFIKGEFLYNMPCSKPNFWREATEEEVIQAFEKECIRMFGEDWKDVKIKSCVKYGDSRLLNDGKYVVDIRKYIGGWTVWNKNGCIYYQGKWAEKLEESKFAENLRDIDRPWYLDTYGEAEGLFEKGYQDKNHLPTKELTEGLLALTQLLSFRHDVWEIEGKPEDDKGWYGIMLTVSKEEPRVILLGEIKTEFRFKKKETAEWFLETHRELLTEYQNKLIK